MTVSLPLSVKSDVGKSPCISYSETSQIGDEAAVVAGAVVEAAEDDKEEVKEEDKEEDKDDALDLEDNESLVSNEASLYR